MSSYGDKLPSAELQRRAAAIIEEKLATMTPRQLAAMKRLVSEMGRKGGLASAAKLTPEQRQERARKAVVARWSRRAAR